MKTHFRRQAAPSFSLAARGARRRLPPAFACAGFSLVEILVGMLIGLIGILIMMQIFSFVEGQKRTTTGTGDAQTSGVAALYELQRDIRLAGFGFNSLSAMGCSLNVGGGRVLPALGHIIINPKTADNSAPLFPAGDANTDTILIAYGTTNGATEGERMVNSFGSQYMMPSSKTYLAGDTVMASPSEPNIQCLTRPLTLDKVTAQSGQMLTVATGDSEYAKSEATLFNWGASPKIMVHAVRKGNLTVCDYLANNCAESCTAADGSCNPMWVPVADNIVSVRAQYGRNTQVPLSGTGVNVWDQQTPTYDAATDTLPEAYPCKWVRVPAVRLAVVARNAQIEKENATLAAPTWYGSDTAAHAIDLTADTNWQRYRYRLFQTVIPIRNMPWITQCP